MTRKESKSEGNLVWYPMVNRRREWHWEVYKSKRHVGIREFRHNVALRLVRPSIETIARVEVSGPEMTVLCATDVPKFEVEPDQPDIRKIKAWMKEWVADQLESPMDALVGGLIRWVWRRP